MTSLFLFEKWEEEEMSRFTKGPWRQGSGSPSYVLVDDGSSPSKIVARAYPNDVPSGELEANAQLIAAAPDMYEALKELAYVCGKLPGYEHQLVGSALRSARAALELIGDSDETI